MSRKNAKLIAKRRNKKAESQRETHHTETLVRTNLEMFPVAHYASKGYRPSLKAKKENMNKPLSEWRKPKTMRLDPKRTPKTYKPFSLS